MKKKKPIKKISGDFTNNPFQPLRKFTPREGAPAAPKPAKVMRTAGDEDEATLFLRAAEGVRRLHEPGTQSSPGTRRERERSGEPAADDDKRLFLDAVQKIGAPGRNEAAEPEEPAERRSSAGRLRQLKRGLIRIGGALDLHGTIREEALVRLERFVAAAYAGGQQAVLVITGKGINSPEGPVLQGAVAAWLRGKGTGMVAEFAPAPRDLGGSGAFVVFLKSR